MSSSGCSWAIVVRVEFVPGPTMSGRPSSVHTAAHLAITDVRSAASRVARSPVVPRATIPVAPSPRRRRHSASSASRSTPRIREAEDDDALRDLGLGGDDRARARRRRVTRRNHGRPTCPKNQPRRHPRGGSRRARRRAALADGYARASYTMLNGEVWAARKWAKPASSNTARMPASPDCAPIPRPTSWASELGVQRNVDAW